MSLQHLGRDNIAVILTSTASALTYGDTGATIQVSSATSTGFSSTSTSVGGNPYVMTMEATYPQVSTNVMTFRGVATTDDANHEWNTWGISNATATGAGDLLNRVYEALGEKTSSQSWQITCTLTVST